MAHMGDSYICISINNYYCQLGLVYIIIIPARIARVAYSKRKRLGIC